ncbi:hypothetical protein AGMMS49592_0610 [Endomicrobiia bacterium]|nr:hypothetical protein AGMMS49592_0610 [Endomicrobiia bacterium]
METMEINGRTFYLKEAKGRDKKLEQKRIECPSCAAKQRSWLEIGDKITLFKGNVLYCIKDTDFKITDKVEIPLFKSEKFTSVRLKEDVDAELVKIKNDDGSYMKFYRLCDEVPAEKIMLMKLNFIYPTFAFEEKTDYLVTPNYYLVDEYFDDNFHGRESYNHPQSHNTILETCNYGKD